MLFGISIKNIRYVGECFVNIFDSLICFWVLVNIFGIVIIFILGMVNG